MDNEQNTNEPMKNGEAQVWRVPMLVEIKREDRGGIAAYTATASGHDVYGYFDRYYDQIVAHLELMASEAQGEMVRWSEWRPAKFAPGDLHPDACKALTALAHEAMNWLEDLRDPFHDRTDTIPRSIEVIGALVNALEGKWGDVETWLDDVARLDSNKETKE